MHELSQSVLVFAPFLYYGLFVDGFFGSNKDNRVLKNWIGLVAASMPLIIFAAGEGLVGDTLFLEVPAVAGLLIGFIIGSLRSWHQDS